MGKVNNKGSRLGSSPPRDVAPTAAGLRNDPPAVDPPVGDPPIPPIDPIAPRRSPLLPADATGDRTPVLLQQQLQQRRHHGGSNDSSNSRWLQQQQRRRELSPTLSLDDILGRVTAAVSDAFLPYAAQWALEGRTP